MSGTCTGGGTRSTANANATEYNRLPADSDPLHATRLETSNSVAVTVAVEPKSAGSLLSALRYLLHDQLDRLRSQGYSRSWNFSCEEVAAGRQLELQLHLARARQSRLRLFQCVLVNLRLTGSER